MPHSTGGGSSHGGFHSSGGGGSYGGSSLHYGESISKLYRDANSASRRYRRGNSVFVRYGFNKRPRYYYSSGYSLGAHGEDFWEAVVFAVIFLIIGLFITAASLNIPARMKSTESYRQDIDVTGTPDVIGDTRALRSALNDFYDTTGIATVVVQVDVDEWKGNGYSLEQYAYNWYVSQFKDETHWVILYSEDSDAWGSDKFGDWYWEGMAGDDTTSILTGRFTDKFNKLAQSNILSYGEGNVANAMAATFRELTPNVMDKEFKWTTGIAGIVLIGVGAIMIVVSLLPYIGSKVRYAGYKQVYNAQIKDDVPLEDTCKYCDGVYVVGTVTNCPHCGAGLPAHNPYNK